VGVPDPPAFSSRPRHRRGEDAPRIEPIPWCRAFARRVEAQFRRDWTLGFGLWNFIFRELLNLRRSLYVVERRAAADPAAFGIDGIEGAAVALVEALSGRYRDPAGYLRPVNGDFTKLRYVPTLSDGACRLVHRVWGAGGWESQGDTMGYRDGVWNRSVRRVCET